MGKTPRQTGPDADLPPLQPAVWHLIHADGTLRREYQPSLTGEPDTTHAGNLNAVRWPEEYTTYRRLREEYGPRYREAVAQDQQIQTYIAQRKGLTDDPR